MKFVVRCITITIVSYMFCISLNFGNKKRYIVKSDYQIIWYIQLTIGAKYQSGRLSSTSGVL